MCEECESLANAIPSGKGTGLFTRLILPHPCKHEKSCTCEKCERYRDKAKP